MGVKIILYNNCIKRNELFKPSQLFNVLQKAEALSERDLLTSPDMWWKVYRIMEVHNVPFDIIIDDIKMYVMYIEC